MIVSEVRNFANQVVAKHPPSSIRIRAMNILMLTAKSEPKDQVSAAVMAEVNSIVLRVAMTNDVVARKLMDTLPEDEEIVYPVMEGGLAGS